MRKIVFILTAAIALSSCSLDISDTKTVIISVALDYCAEDGFSQSNYLSNPPNDQEAFVSQTELLAGPRNTEKHIFLSKGGTRTVNGTESEWNEEDVLETIMNLDTESDDLIIFYYSGHGEDITGNLVLSKSDNGFGTISPEELLYAMSTLDGKKCIFLDSCYSGKYVDDLGLLGNGEIFGDDGSLIRDGFVSSLYPSLKISLLAGYTGSNDIWTMSATTSEQLSYDSGTEGRPNQDKYGAFTYFLLLALGYDAEEDCPMAITGRGEITFYGVYKGIKERMSRSMWSVQTPQVTLSPLDLILF